MRMQYAVRMQCMCMCAVPRDGAVGKRSVRTVHMERACLQREEEQRVRELGEDGASQRLLQHRK